MVKHTGDGEDSDMANKEGVLKMKMEKIEDDNNNVAVLGVKEQNDGG